MKVTGWAYGITTIPERRSTTFPRTLASLRASGFDRPWLFVDGDYDAKSWEEEFSLKDGNGHGMVTARQQRIRTYGNWILSLAELYIREPLVSHYAIFQDDFVTYKNLRRYLEKNPCQDRGYMNLYTFPCNQVLCPREKNGSQRVGWFRANQLGKGAVALIFDRETVLTLLTHQHTVNKPTDAHRGWRTVDGAVVQALVLSYNRGEGWTEYCHNPSLVQHIGMESSMGNLPHEKAPSFRGEEFDCLSLLQEAKCS